MTDADDGKAFITCPKGGLDFGVIDSPEIRAAGIKTGPIRLQVGYAGAKGFGYLHVHHYDDRVKQIQGLGYSGIAEFCVAVAANFTTVGDGHDGRIIVIWHTQFYDLQLVLQWHEQGFWTIVTAVPARKARKCTVICVISRTSGSEPTPVVAKQPRFAILSLPKKDDAGSNGS